MMLTIFVDADNIQDPQKLQDYGLFKALSSIFGNHCQVVVRGNHCGSWKDHWEPFLAPAFQPEAVDMQVVSQGEQATDAEMLALLLERRPQHVVLLSNDMLLRQTFASLCKRLGLSFYGAPPETPSKTQAKASKAAVKASKAAKAAPKAKPVDANAVLRAHEELRQWIMKHPAFDQKTSVPDNAIASLAQKSGLPAEALKQADHERLLQSQDDKEESKDYAYFCA